MKFQTLSLLVVLIMALHFLLRLRLAYGSGRWLSPVILALLALVLIHNWPGQIHNWLGQAAEGFFYAAPLALGYLLFFLLAALALDLLRLALAAIFALGAAPAAWREILTAKKSVSLALVLAALLTLVSNYQAYRPRLVTVELETSRLPAGVDELRIVQVSDVHLSRFIGQAELRNILALVKEADPDLVVFTGDLLDSPPGAAYEDEAALLAGLKPRLGVFAVLGNHETYFGLEAALDFYRRAGFRLLRGKAKKLKGLVVAGVDDAAGGEEAVRLLKNFKDDRRFILFLKHRPTPAPDLPGLFDLQLSGHTHGGQIWPNHVPTARANGRLLHGLYPALGRGWIYVSRGAGFWGLPLRFLAPPEVTLFKLRHG
ncbi:MAG: metallophosphoesterase [Candidatus Adiutrix sp.]|jgi:predicted MPP superfamily phosphohydrolase|nr:metallophosphoesterase [Candidatus Adiutrix sp.]